MIVKIFDAVILIRIIYECDFSELFQNWALSKKYCLLVPHEVYEEILNQRDTIDSLTKNNIVKKHAPIEKNILNSYQKMYPKLSLSDCSVLYFGIKIQNSICLTDDKPLRKILLKKNIRTSGTMGIYNKLKKLNVYLAPLNSFNTLSSKILIIFETSIIYSLLYLIFNFLLRD